MADKKNQPRDGAEKAKDGAARPETRRFGESRRRLPLAALALLLALIGVGIYVAWPAIQESLRSPALQGAVETDSGAAVEQERAGVPAPRPAANSEPAPRKEDTRGAAAEPSPALQALGAQIAALEKALAERAAAPPPAAPDLSPLRDAMARLEAVERRLDQAAASAPAESPAPLAPEVPEAPGGAAESPILERLDALEKALPGRDSSALIAEVAKLRAGQAALRRQLADTRRLLESLGRGKAEEGRTMVLVLSLSRLSRAAAAGPFERELAALRAAAQSDGAANSALARAIRDLAAHAPAGAPTLAALSAAFDDMALAVIRADSAAEEQGWVEATIGRLRRVVTVRRVGGEIEADSLEGRLSALHAALAMGDLGAAISLAEALPTKARGGAEEWLAGARARLDVERALGVLDAEISARVAARWTAAERDGPRSNDN